MTSDLKDYVVAVMSINNALEKTKPRATEEKIQAQFERALFGQLSIKKYTTWAIDVSDQEGRNFLCKLGDAIGNRHCENTK